MFTCSVCLLSASAPFAPGVMGNGNFLVSYVHESWHSTNASERVGYECRKKFDPIEVDRYHRRHRKYDRFRALPDGEEHEKPGEAAIKPVWAVAVAQEAQILAAATADHDVHLWSIGQHMHLEILVTLKGHSGQVWEVKFCTNESQLATGSSDLTIRLWETETGRPLGVLRGHSATIRSLAFSWHGYMISGDENGELFVWQEERIEPLTHWKAHDGNVHSVAWSLPVDKRVNQTWADSKKTIDKEYHPLKAPAWQKARRDNPLMALSIGADGTVASWNFNSEDEEATIGGRFAATDHGAVLCVAAHPQDEGVAAVGNQDGSVWLWFFEANERTGQTEVQIEPTGHNRLKGHEAAVFWIEYSKDGCLLVSGSADGSIRVWDAQNVTMPCLTCVFHAHDSWVRQVHFFKFLNNVKEPRTLVSCGADGKVALWMAPKRLRNQTLQERQPPKKPARKGKILDEGQRQRQAAILGLGAMAVGTEDPPPPAIEDHSSQLALEDSTAGEARPPAILDGPPRPALPPPPPSATMQLPPGPLPGSLAAPSPPDVGPGAPPPPPSATAPRRGGQVPGWAQLGGGSANMNKTLT